MRAIMVLAAFCMLFAAAAHAQDNVAGSVTNADGDAWIVRAGQEMPAQQGLRLYESDSVRTGSDGAMGVILRDDTVLSFGPNTEAVLETFLFDPSQEEFGFTLNVLKGTAAYLSGAIGRLAPESISVVTPQAVLGVKGTHFLIEVR